MKFIIAYYLLLVYASALFRPVFALVSDAAAHTFYEAVHISTVHMVEGSQHLEKEVASDNTDNKKGTRNAEKALEPFALHLFQTVLPYISSPIVPFSGFSSLPVSKLPCCFISLLVPPPDFLG